jgi:branched-chain amino acid aminotransferase
MASQERIAYINGNFMPESQAAIPIRDRGFIYGDAAFDVARTFQGRPFRLREHLDRLYASCRYLRLDPGMSQDTMEDLTLEVLRQNIPLLGENEDYWVTQRVTRGVETPDGDVPTVLIECRPLPLASRARYYRSGVPMVTPSVPRTPPQFLSPRAKTHNYLNMVMGDLEARDRNPEAWALLLDERGNLAEGKGCNVFIVKDGAIHTPSVQCVLPGITRDVVLELAQSTGVPANERDIDLYDAYTSEEAFLTSMSLCICPVASLNGTVIGDGNVPGPVTSGLIAAFSDLVGMDYVGQYLAHEAR